MASTVAAIVLNWNNYEDTRDCLSSLSSLSDSLKVILVDNGSTDGSGQRLEEEFDIQVVHTGENLGFSGGMNAGIKMALHAEVEFVWILNNDTQFPDTTVVTRAVERMEDNPEIGILSPIILESQSDDQVWFKCGEIDRKNGTVHHETQCRAGDDDVITENDYIPLCAAFIRSDVFKEAGLLPEKYFLYYEDVEFGTRVRKHGYTLVTDPSIEVDHKVGGSSTGPMGPLFSYYVMRNVLLFSRDHRGELENLFPLYYGTWVSKSLGKALLKRQADSTVAIIRGFFDGIRGESGRGPYP